MKVFPDKTRKECRKNSTLHHLRTIKAGWIDNDELCLLLNQCADLIAKVKDNFNSVQFIMKLFCQEMDT